MFSKIEILEVMSSTNLNSFGDVSLVYSQYFFVYKKAKIKVDLKNKEDY